MPLSIRLLDSRAERYSQATTSTMDLVITPFEPYFPVFFLFSRHSYFRALRSLTPQLLIAKSDQCHSSRSQTSPPWRLSLFSFSWSSFCPQDYKQNEGFTDTVMICKYIMPTYSVSRLVFRLDFVMPPILAKVFLASKR